jgi:hypothetical protein
MAARPRVVVAGAGLLGRALTEFAKYTAAKYGGLDGQWCFNPVGRLDLATTPERLAALKRRHGWATSWGVRGDLRTPGEWSTRDLSAEETYVGDVPVVALRLSTVAEPGTPVEIEYFGERVPGSVA